MAEFNIQKMFHEVATYALKFIGGYFGDLAFALVSAFAVVMLILEGIKRYYADEPPGRLIYLGLVRIGFCVYLVVNYRELFYDYLWMGIYNDLALELGTLRIINIGYRVLLASAALLVASGIASIFVGGIAIFIGGGLFVLVAGTYACIVMGGISAVLIAGAYLVLGQFVICLLLFDATQHLFFGWLRGYIGALFGIALWYFFLGALSDFDYWHVLNGMSFVRDLDFIVTQLIHMLLLFVTTAYTSIKAPEIGRRIFG